MSKQPSVDALADKLSHAKSEAQSVWEQFPDNADSGRELEQAIGLLGKCVDELDSLWMAARQSKR